MDSFADVTGVLLVMAMIWVGWLVARVAWREAQSQAAPPPPPPPQPPPGDVWLPLVID